MTPELSRMVPLDRISGAGVEELVAANTAERAAVARRLGVPALAALRCHFRLTPVAHGPVAHGTVAASGVLHAVVTRVCVVSLEEFETEIEEHFTLRFVPAGQESATIDPDAEDEVTFTDDRLDLGEAAVEQLALALEPYPRRPGALLPDTAETAAGPFAALLGGTGPH